MRAFKGHNGNTLGSKTKNSVIHPIILYWYKVIPKYGHIEKFLRQVFIGCCNAAIHTCCYGSFTTVFVV